MPEFHGAAGEGSSFMRGKHNESVTGISRNARASLP